MSQHTPEAPSQKISDFPLRIYVEDTDFGGIVYHSQYLNFAERARSNWLITKGKALFDSMMEQGQIFVVQKLDIAYFKSASLYDELNVELHLLKHTPLRIFFMQRFMRGEEELGRMHVVIAAIDKKTQAPTRLDAALLKKTLAHAFDA